MSQIYRFRMLSDENDNFVRDFEVPAESSLLDMHDFIIEMLGYDPCITRSMRPTSSGSRLTNTPRWTWALPPTLPCPARRWQRRVCDVMHNLHDRPHIPVRQHQPACILPRTRRGQEAAGRHDIPGACSSSTRPPPDQYDPEANERAASIFDEMMGEYNDFEATTTHDDEY